MMKKGKKHTKNRRGWLLFLAGILLVFYPYFMEAKLSLHTAREISQFEKDYAPSKGIKTVDEDQEQVDSTQKKANIGKEEERKNDPEKVSLWQAVQRYNDEIYRNRQAEFSDPYALCQVPVTLKELKRTCFGYIEIPSMHVRLALYIGATKENMAKGAVILSQTSLPVGGINTCSVIAAHRGYCGAAYFRDIEKVRPGDKIYIENPWETLCYEAVNLAVIDPCDSDQVKIQEGKDMVTLLTCHPYRSHGKKRYLVYCTRCKTDRAENEEKSSETENKKEKDPTVVEHSSVHDIRRENHIRIAAVVILAAMCALLWRRRIRSERNNQKK